MTAPGAPLRLAILVDYDGTICRTSVSDQIMVDNSVRPGWLELDAGYVAGTVGSRDELVSFLDLLPRERAPLVATAERQEHDESFSAFAKLAGRLGVTVEVVSDGFGFYVAPALERLGVPGLPISTSKMTWDGDGAHLAFPFGHPACFVCGTCKRERVLAHQSHGLHVAFVGDGVSDRYAAVHADTVFGKDLLADVCARDGIPCLAWETFADISAWLEEVAADPGGLAPPRSRPYVCGPEVWGPGRHAPLPADRDGGRPGQADPPRAFAADLSLPGGSPPARPGARRGPREPDPPGPR